MMEKIKQLKDRAVEEIEKIKDSGEIEKVWRKYLGRQDGELTRILRELKDLPMKERPKVGSFANQVKKEIEDFLNEKKQAGGKVKKEKGEFVDFTLPGGRTEYGHVHPLTQMRGDIAGIFSSMGFEVLEGPELETDYYNFEALNIPAGHPARDMWDTFYLKSRINADNISVNPRTNQRKSALLLRTHTSPMQVRVMEKRKPPLKICVIGRCFRHEATDASHEHTLHQVEGFVVDKEITVANLIYTLKTFLDVLFNRKVKIRLRPSYFPFTEPSFEVDFACLNCQGKGCPVCKNTGWVEILGSGMIHPKVFESAGYLPAEALAKVGLGGKYTGFAFGVGLDRLVMMKYKIDDIRWLHSGDLRFIRQF